MTNGKKTLVQEHTDRCIGLYGNPINDTYNKKVDLTLYEQLRADLLLCVGMLMAKETPRHD